MQPPNIMHPLIFYAYKIVLYCTVLEFINRVAHWVLETMRSMIQYIQYSGYSYFTVYRRVRILGIWPSSKVLTTATLQVPS